MCLHYSLVRLYSRHSHEALAAVDHCAGMIDVEAALIKRVTAFLNSDFLRGFWLRRAACVNFLHQFPSFSTRETQSNCSHSLVAWPTQTWTPGSWGYWPRSHPMAESSSLRTRPLRGHPGSIHMDTFSKKNTGGESVLEYATCEMDESA